MVHLKSRAPIPIVIFDSERLREHLLFNSAISMGE